MLNLVRCILASLTAFFLFTLGKDFKKAQKEGTLEMESTPKVLFTGFITDFFDALGIGSFAITIALSKALKLNIPDKYMPGTLNVAHTIPVVLQAFIFTTIIEVNPITLISMIIASVAGACIGAGIISRMDEMKIQLVMGISLLVTALLMFLSHPMINLMPIGGEAIGLTGVSLVIGLVGNFILGALMTAGIGLYAPCMALVYLLGMSPKVAFPIMMGSCAMLMPIASSRFIKEQAYAKKASVLIALSGTFGVLLAAFGVSNMPMDLLKALVIIVVLYTAINMIIKVKKQKIDKYISKSK